MKFCLRSIVLLITACVAFASGQTVRKLTLDADRDFLLREARAIFRDDHGTITVTDMLPAPPGSESKPPADIRKGDVLVMVNGTRPDGIRGLHKLYDALPAGKEFKIGLRRDGQAVIAVIIKSDENADPGARVMTMRVNGDDLSILPGIGVFDKKENGLKIRELPPESDPAAHSSLRAGDVIRAIDGTSLKSFRQLESLYNDVTPGSTVRLDIVRNGKSLRVPVVKPEGRQRIIIKR